LIGALAQQALVILLYCGIRARKIKSGERKQQQKRGLLDELRNESDV
jgi:hypothetical protein